MSQSVIIGQIAYFLADLCILGPDLVIMVSTYTVTQGPQAGLKMKTQTTLNCYSKMIIDIAIL